MDSPPISERYRGRSVLITGGLGFIGSNLAHRLVQMGEVDVCIVDSLLENLGGNPFNVETIRDRLSVHLADIGDTFTMSHLLGRFDFVFNLAGNVSHLDSMSSPQSDLEANCRAQLKFLEACRKFNPEVRVVYASTRQVYGKPAYLPVDENHVCAPIDINGVHKLAAEQYHLLYHRVHGLRATCLRMTNTYGPRQLIRHSRQSVIAWFIRQALDGGTIKLFGGGQQQRDFNYVDDVVDALLLVGASRKAEGDVFNLGGSEPITLAALAAQLIQLTGQGSISNAPFPIERRSIDIGDCYSSYQKLETSLGWRPRVSLADGLTRTIEYYQKNYEQYCDANVDSLSGPLATV